MSQIGQFTRTDDGFFGRIRTLNLDVEAAILPVDGAAAEHAPNHRVFANAFEVGAAWDRTSERAGSYLAVTIDDPSFVAPLRARLFESDAKTNAWTLHWSRKTKRDGQD